MHGDRTHERRFLRVPGYGNIRECDVAIVRAIEQRSAFQCARFADQRSGDGLQQFGSRYVAAPVVQRRPSCYFIYGYGVARWPHVFDLRRAGLRDHGAFKWCPVHLHCDGDERERTIDTFGGLKSRDANRDSGSTRVGDGIGGQRRGRRFVVSTRA